MRVEILTPTMLRAATLKLQQMKRGAPPSPRVVVVPFIAEQGEEASQRAPGPLLVSEVLKHINSILPSVHMARWAADDDEFWASHLPSFVRKVAPSLPAVTIALSHGNFMRKQLSTGRVPNGGVVQLTLDTSQIILFVRHCTSRHNVTKKGRSSLTMCLDFDRLDPVAKFAQALMQGTECAVVSSPLPRAVVSALALQRAISKDEMHDLTRVFGDSPEQVPLEVRAAYEAKWDCRASPSEFCDQA
jgi:hypothetical protein